MNSYQFNFVISSLIPEGMETGPFDWEVEEEKFAKITEMIDESYEPAYSLQIEHNEVTLYCSVDANDDATAMIEGNKIIISAFLAADYLAPGEVKISVIKK